MCMDAYGQACYICIAGQLGGEEAELLSIPQLVKQKKYEFEAGEIGGNISVCGFRRMVCLFRFYAKNYCGLFN